ncbi:hypothetical protein BJ166DRAFT_542809 [Pestalotiopsis sp. NC0098]|nr:hypothetical protein BJ166DRAFT_542809 [Pestalotiopsis sp. NC0098]
MASIASLPAEILSPILRLAVEAGPTTAGACAAVSRQWQQHVESQTFASLTLDVWRAAQAKDILTPARQSRVRHICMEARLPEYNPFILQDRRVERWQNNQIFTEAIQMLFSCLSHWAPATIGTGQRGVRLELWAFSPTDSRDDFRAQTWMRRWVNFYLTLTEGSEDDLPDLSMITEFVGRTIDVYDGSNPHDRRYYHRHIEARVFGVMAAKMTRLESVDWELVDYEKLVIPFRQRMRKRFAASLASLPQSVRHFRLWYPHQGPMNHDAQPRRAYDDRLESDPLSIALRRIAQQCIKFILEWDMVFDTNLFWPQPQPSSPDETLHWPHLEILVVRSSMVSPSGTWLFHADPLVPPGPPPEPQFPENSPEVLTGNHPWNPYRVLLNRRYYTEVSLAVARAAARMPRLRRLMVQWGTVRTCKFGYQVMGRGTTAEYWSESTPALQLTAGLEEAWRTAAKVHIGEGRELSFDLVDLDQYPPSLYGAGWDEVPWNVRQHLADEYYYTTGLSYST